MGIGVECPECRTSFRVAEQHAGKRGRCPKCRGVIELPEAPPVSTPLPAEVGDGDGSETYELEGARKAGASARMTAARASVAASKPIEPAPTRPTRTPIEILASFRGEIKRVRPSLMYRAWILIIAVVMLILPAIYLALIALVGYGVYLHAITNHTLLQGTNRHSLQIAAVVYVGPIVAGVVVIAFMFKPLFAGRAKQVKVRRIDLGKEPLIGAFVEGVCSSVGAPKPARIEVDCQVNATARLASWVLSPSRELVLTIGLPLVAGLTLRQFTGVLAHEFGHFSQGTGMRLLVLIRSINLWFARVVYERDEWDESLASATSGNHWAIILLAYLALASVWLTRRVLWVLMYVARLVSGFLARQMEFDADCYEARMVGGATFAKTMERLNELGLAWRVAHSALANHWRERRLPDDLPRLVVVEAAKLPDALKAVIRAGMEQGRTGLFDTHPADRERIARALREGPEGIFRLDGPATDLFRDFDALARDTTFDYYRSMLGRDVSQDQLFPIAQALLDHEVLREGGEAFDRFFLGGLGPLQAFPLPVAYPTPPADPKAAKRSIVAARRVMLDGLEANKAALQSWGDLHDKASKALGATALLKAGKPGLDGSMFGLEKAKLPLAESARSRALQGLEAIDADLAPFGAAASERLATALGLLELDLVAARVADGPARREEARALYACGMTLATRVVPSLAPLLRAIQGAGLVVSVYQTGKNSQDEATINGLLRSARQVHEALTELKWKLGDAVDYPFEHAQENVTLGRYALPIVPDAQAVGDLLQVGGETQERVLALFSRILGRLAAIAEAVELGIGLKPLEVPEA